MWLMTASRFQSRSEDKYQLYELEILSFDDAYVIVTLPTRDSNETKPMPVGGTLGADPYSVI